MNNDFNSLLAQLNNGNNFISPQQRNNYYAPHYEIIQVNGRAGAENFRMGPNSSALLLDNSAPIIWFVKTDGSGLISATPCDYSIHQDPPPINLNDIQERLTALEEKLNNVSSNSRTTKRNAKQQSTESANQIVDTTT